MIELPWLPLPETIRDGEWKAGDLNERWRDAYPCLFDKNMFDETLTQPNHHYHEWLSSVILHTATGFWGVLGKYDREAKHPQQFKHFASVVPPEVREKVSSSGLGGTQYPDLLMFLPDYSRFFFCEVKGPKDRRKDNQESLVSVLESAFPCTVFRLWYKSKNVPGVESADDYIVWAQSHPAIQQVKEHLGGVIA